MSGTLTLDAVYDGLSKRMDTMTHEITKNGKTVDRLTIQVTSIEHSLNDIEFKDGDNHITKVPRLQFFQDLYDFSKPDGLLEQKMKTCKESHNPTRNLELAGKKFDIWWKWGQRIVFAFMVVFVLYEVTGGRKLIIERVVNTGHSATPVSK